jgi:DNA-directed RNA polymerase specialized sigma24 family protein
MTPKTSDRCTEQDYRNLFATSAEELRWLAHTLTGDDSLSEKVMDAALEQSLKGANRVFREWMLSWARRLIVRFCIGVVRPAEGLGDGVSRKSEADFSAIDADDVSAVLDLPSDQLQKKLLGLDPLPRFVFALRAIEECSRRDTALLLGIDDRTCEFAYRRAVQALRFKLFEVREFGARMELVAV